MAGTVIEYLQKYGDISFREKPLNDVDSLALCQLSYLKFDGMVSDVRHNGPSVTLREIAERPDVDKLFGDVRFEKENRALFEGMLSGRRFRDMKLNCYINLVEKEWETQFSAITFILDDGTLFLAFRGTDETIVGWKEDFNMAFLSPVPGQEYSVKYVNMVTGWLHQPFYIGGHSKGGNLAAWAGLHLPHKNYGRLLAVYNNDGPGFNRSMTERPEYVLLRDRMHTFIPESSIVGVLLEHCEDYTVIASTAKSIMQHEALSWCTERNRFIHLEERSTMGRRSDDVLRDWIGSMTPQERKDFTDAFFEILSMGGKARTLDDVQEMGLSGAVALVKEYAGADEKTRRILVETFKRLAVDIGEEVASSAQDGLKQATGFLRNLGRKKPTE